jgi:hypothetical protein
MRSGISFYERMPVSFGSGVALLAGLPSELSHRADRGARLALFPLALRLVMHPVAVGEVSPVPARQPAGGALLRRVRAPLVIWSAARAQRAGLVGSASMRPVAWNLFPTGTATIATGAPGLSLWTVAGSSLAMSIITTRPSSLFTNRFWPAIPYTLPRMVTHLASSPGLERASSRRAGGPAAAPGADGGVPAGAGGGGDVAPDVVGTTWAIARDSAAVSPLPSATTTISWDLRPSKPRSAA